MALRITGVTGSPRRCPRLHPLPAATGNNCYRDVGTRNPCLAVGQKPGEAPVSRQKKGSGAARKLLRLQSRPYSLRGPPSHLSLRSRIVSWDLRRCTRQAPSVSSFCALSIFGRLTAGFGRSAANGETGKSASRRAAIKSWDTVNRSPTAFSYVILRSQQLGQLFAV